MTPEQFQRKLTNHHRAQDPRRMCEASDPCRRPATRTVYGTTADGRADYCRSCKQHADEAQATQTLRYTDGHTGQRREFVAVDMIGIDMRGP
jgi:hypothetical protein